MPDEMREHCAHLSGAMMRTDLDVVDAPGGYIAVDRGQRTFGVFDRARKFVSQSLSYRYDAARHQKIPRRTCLRRAPFINETVLYCGRDMGFHFGHFLLEGLSRIWPVLSDEYRGMKLVFTQNEYAAMPSYGWELLRLAGVHPDDVIMINKSTCFFRVYVPRQSFCIALYASPQFASVMRRIADAARGDALYDKVYLSRAKMGERKTYGEERVQKIFEQNGYTVIYPETLPLEQQIYIAAHCTHMAGCAGTALHLAAFMRPGGTVIQLKRNSAPDDSSMTQALICRMVGARLVSVWASIENTPTPHFTDTPQIIGVTTQMQCFFNDAHFSYDAADIAPNVTAWGEYNIAMERYRARRGSDVSRRIRGMIVRLVGGLIPVATWRRRARHHLRNILHLGR